MMGNQVLTDGILVVFCVLCILTDLYTRKIPNKLTFTVGTLSIVLNSYQLGLSGTLKSLGGIVLAFGLLLIPFITRGLAAGDVKMLMAIGALKGEYFTLGTTVYMALIGGVLAIIWMLSSNKPSYFLRKIKIYFTNSILLGNLEQWNQEDIPTRQQYMPYAVAIGLGAILFMIIQRL